MHTQKHKSTTQIHNNDNMTYIFMNQHKNNTVQTKLTIYQTKPKTNKGVQNKTDTTTTIIYIYITKHKQQHKQKHHTSTQLVKTNT